MDKDIFAKLNYTLFSHFRINLTQAISFQFFTSMFSFKHISFFCWLKFIREVVFDEDNKTFF